MGGRLLVSFPTNPVYILLHLTGFVKYHKVSLGINFSNIFAFIFLALDTEYPTPTATFDIFLHST